MSSERAGNVCFVIVHDRAAVGLQSEIADEAARGGDSYDADGGCLAKWSTVPINIAIIRRTQYQLRS